jgi:stress response protein YsnF
VSDYAARHATTDDAASEGDGLTRSEEELRVGTRTETVGALRLRKTVAAERVSDVVGRDVESAEPVRSAPLEHDSGEIVTLPDGSVSVPVFEEELVVTKRLVVRERIVVQKARETEDVRVEEDLLRERVDVEVDTGILREREDEGLG